MRLADIEEQARRDDGSLGDASIAALRDRRRELDACETQVSYVRRTLQARIDLIEATLDVRVDSDGAADRLEDLLATLPDLLTPRRPTLSQRSPRHRPVVDPDIELLREVDGPPALSTFAIPEASEADLRTEHRRLVELERRVSELRRRLHRSLDAIQADIARRYQAGELSATR